MALYEAGWTSTVNTVGLPTASIKAGASWGFKLYEVCIHSGAANTLQIGIGRPANDPAMVQTSPTLFQATTPGDAVSLTTYAVAWATAPTQPNVFMRRGNIVNAVGVGVIWTFPRGLTVLLNQGLVFWNLVAGTNPTAYNAMIEEK